MMTWRQGRSGNVSIEAFIEQFVTAVDFQEQVPIAPDTKLTDLPEWDSLAALGVIVMFDIEYNKTVTGPDLAKCATIADLYQLAQ
jgi:acyl carrier protein